MSSDAAIYVLLGICGIIVVLVVFPKQLKLLSRLILNASMGIFGLIGMNFLLSPFSLSIGVNPLTVLIVGVLGIPGFICLYLSRLLL